MVVFALILGLFGVRAFAKGGQWRDLSVPPPLPAQPPPFPRSNFRPNPPRTNRQNHSSPPERPVTAPRPSPKAESSIAKRIEAIDWFQFEKVTCRILKKEYSWVKHHGGGGADGGVDIVATEYPRVAIVQCKHWILPVDKLELEKLVAAPTYYRFKDIKVNWLIFFSSISGYDDEAVGTAKKHCVELWGPVEIGAAIAAIGLEQFPELMEPGKKFCPKSRWLGKELPTIPCPGELVEIVLSSKKYRVPRGTKGWICKDCGTEFNRHLRSPSIY